MKRSASSRRRASMWRRPGPTPRGSRSRGTTRRTRCVASKQTGQISWQGDLVFVSEAVRGELIGLAETERGDWTVRFMHVELGRIDRQTRRFTPAWHGRRIG